MGCVTINGSGSETCCRAVRAGWGDGADNRLFVEAVLYRYRAGIPWRDLPERFGDWSGAATLQPMGHPAFGNGSSSSSPQMPTMNTR